MLYRTTGLDSSTSQCFPQQVYKKGRAKLFQIETEQTEPNKMSEPNEILVQ